MDDLPLAPNTLNVMIFLTGPRELQWSSAGSYYARLSLWCRTRSEGAYHYLSCYFVVASWNFSLFKSVPCVGLILEENTLEHNTTDKMAVWICQNVSAQKCKHANQDNLFTNPHTYICSIYTSFLSVSACQCATSLSTCNGTKYPITSASWHFNAIRASSLDVIEIWSPCLHEQMSLTE